MDINEIKHKLSELSHTSSSIDGEVIDDIDAIIEEETPGEDSDYLEAVELLDATHDLITLMEGVKVPPNIRREIVDLKKRLVAYMVGEGA